MASLLGFQHIHSQISASGSNAVTTFPHHPGSLEASANFHGKRVAVLLYSTYPSDPRPRRAAEALAQYGAAVEVICLKQDDREATEETVGGVRVRRLPHKHQRGGKIAYVWQYSAFLVATFVILGWRAMFKRYHLVHVHNMPDVLVFSALIPKLLGARVILDLHDPMPELMMTIFGSGPDSAGTRILKRLEKWSIAFADVVLTVNEACRKIFSRRSCPLEKVTVVMNAPDEGIFQYRAFGEPNADARNDQRPFVLMYHGSLVERHGLDLAVTALGIARQSYPLVQLRVYGKRTPFLDRVLASLNGTALQDAVQFFGPKGLGQIVEAINECDVGIIPNRRSIFTELNTPTRIFEYLSQGKPVIAPRSSGILDYFGPGDLIYFELGDSKDLAEKIESVIRDPAGAAASVRRGQEIYRSHCWTRERQRLLHVFATLLNGNGRSAVETPVRETATP
jgi:glycosyltransferase involved in cell wall biosynthesis